MNRRTDNPFDLDLLTGISTSSPDDGGSTAPGRPFHPGSHGDLTLYQPPGGVSLDPVPGDENPQNPDVPDSSNPYPSEPAPLIDDDRLWMYSAVVTLAPEDSFGSTTADAYGLSGSITPIAVESSLLTSIEFL